MHTIMDSQIIKNVKASVDKATFTGMKTFKGMKNNSDMTTFSGPESISDITTIKWKRSISGKKTFKDIKAFILALAILLTGGGLAAQSGWTQPKNSGYFKLSQNFVRASSFFNPDGDIIDITTTSVYVTGVWGEYGITDRLTGVINAPLYVRSTINNKESTVDGTIIPGDEFNGIGDISLGVEYGLIHGKPSVLAISGMVKLPTGENVGGNSELLQSGDGAWGFTALLQGSHSFYPKPFYMSLHAGYQWRGVADLEYSAGTETVNYDDAARWGIELGWTPDVHWLVALKIANVIALGNGTGGGVTGGSSMFGNSISYFGITPEVTYFLDNGIGFSFSIGTAAFAENILAAPSFNVGVVYIVR